MMGSDQTRRPGPGAGAWGGPACLPLLLLLLFWAAPAGADNADEYRLKAAFLYNFISFTEWPAAVGASLNLCVYGPDPFGKDIDKLQGRRVAERSLNVQRVNTADGLDNCQIIFITRPVISNLARVLDAVKGKPVLTVADTPGAARDGATLNLSMEQSRMLFEANLGTAHSYGLALSSKLLRLASEVYQ